MTQPPPRKSSLTGSPVAPPERAPEPTPEAPQGERPAEQPAQPRRASQSKHKLSIYQDPADTARLRAAYRHTLAASTDRSFSDFINRILMAEVERLETQHNGGQPFRGVGAGEIPTGRPVGE
ncbi:MAG: hypothetical protein L0H24_09890 [Microlunatus sp.]|nr:hypothetical protein [Microlunatus sp.]